MKTVQKLYAEIDALNKRYEPKLKALREQFNAIYDNQIAKAKTLDEKWEIYKLSKQRDLDSSYYGNNRIFVYRYNATYFDDMLQPLTEEFKFDLSLYIYEDDEDYRNVIYVNKDKIIKWIDNYDWDNLIEVYSYRLQRDVYIDLPQAVMDQWKLILITNHIGCIEYERYY